MKYKYSQDWDTFHREITRIKQTLINNSYSNTLVDQEINKYLDQQFTSKDKHKYNTIPIYYHNQMHSNYKIDERILKEIAINNTNCINGNDKLNLIIYYKNKQTSNLIMKNNCLPPHHPYNKPNLYMPFLVPCHILR